jgi:hypothetical protein
VRKRTMLRQLVVAGIIDGPTPPPEPQQDQRPAPTPGLDPHVDWDDLDWDAWRAERDKQALARLHRLNAQAQASPERWDADLVGDRIIEGLKVLRRCKGRVAPAGYGSTMPAYVHDWGDKLAQAESPDDDQIRVHIPPTSKELARMEEALAWPMRFLHEHPLEARLVWAWAMARAKPPRRATRSRSGRGEDLEKALETAFREFLSSPHAPGADDLSPAMRAALMGYWHDDMGAIRLRLQRARRRGLTVCAIRLNDLGVDVT